MKTLQKPKYLYVFYRAFAELEHGLGFTDITYTTFKTALPDRYNNYRHTSTIIKFKGCTEYQ